MPCQPKSRGRTITLMDPLSPYTTRYYYKKEKGKNVKAFKKKTKTKPKATAQRAG